MLEVDVDQLERARAEGTPLIDCREPDEYVAGHVPGAVLIPMSQFVERAGEVPSDRQVYVICGVGGRSLKVVEWLRRQGYGEAFSVAGGTKAWVESGRPVVEGDEPG